MTIWINHPDHWCEQRTQQGKFYAKVDFMTKRLCCYIPDQSKLDERCQNLVTYQVYFGYSPTVDDFTETCAEHLEGMLDDNARFEIIRILPDEIA